MLILSFTTTNLLHVYYVNIASYETLEKIKNIVITKPNKGNGVLILDRKVYDNTIQEIISDATTLEKLSEDPTLKGEASLQSFLRKLKQKNFLNEIEYDKLYPSGFAPLVSMVVLKCTNSPLVIHFLNFVQLFHL